MLDLDTFIGAEVKASGKVDTRGEGDGEGKVQEGVHVLKIGYGKLLA